MVFSNVMTRFANHAPGFDKNVLKTRLLHCFSILFFGLDPWSKLGERTIYLHFRKAKWPCEVVAGLRLLSHSANWAVWLQSELQPYICARRGCGHPHFRAQKCVCVCVQGGSGGRGFAKWSPITSRRAENWQRLHYAYWQRPPSVKNTQGQKKLVLVWEQRSRQTISWN